eukprot:symbB.v1.2.029795.t1/scaffold3289.1/size59672/4
MRVSFRSLQGAYQLKGRPLLTSVESIRIWLQRESGSDAESVGLSKQIDRLLEGYCFQILATNRDPEAHNGRVLQTAHLTWILAEYLADTMWLMRSILGHASQILFDNDTQALLTPKFWILPLYRELLNSAHRIRPSTSSERLVVAQGWSKSYVRKTKSRKERGSTMRGRLTRIIEGDLPSGYLAGRPLQGGHPIHCVVSLPQGLPKRSPERILGTNIVMALLVPVGQWRILTALKWCTKSGNGHCQVLQSCRLNVSSRVFWLELDDKALLDSYTVLQEGILCDVFSQKCSAAWQGARGERLTVAIMLPGRQDADDWLNFMLSQKNLWPTFTTRGTLTEEVSEQIFSKERRRLQAKHLWMEVKLRWRVLADRMYTKAPTEKFREELDALLFDRAARRNRTHPYEEKSYRGAAITEVQAWWKQCKDWMAHFKEQSEPFVFDFKNLLKALSGKVAAAQSEVDAFMENCAKRWQTREGTYQLKRRRLKPDVRDSPRI